MKGSVTAVTAVAFDLDGTLVDTMTVVPAAYIDTIRSLGGPDLNPAEITKVWHMGPTATVLGHFLRRPIDRVDLDRFSTILEAAIATIRPFDGVAAMLETLDAHGYALGVYTTATGRAADLMLATAGLKDHIRAVVGGDRATRPKPAPDGLFQLARQLGTAPPHLAYVGEADVDLRCAEAASCLPILAAWGGSPASLAGPPTLLARTPDAVVQIVLSSGSP